MTPSADVGLENTRRFHNPSVRTFSALLGTFEIALALMIAAKPFSWLISAVGSFEAVALFLVTLTFVFTTPDAFQSGYGIPFLSPMPGQFVAKDVGLPGHRRLDRRRGSLGPDELNNAHALAHTLVSGPLRLLSQPGTASAQAAPSAAPPEPRSYDQKDRHD